MDRPASNKTARLLAGVGVDGAGIYISIPVPNGTDACPCCYGNGRNWVEQAYWGAPPSRWEACDQCNGTGLIKQRDDEG